MNSRILGGKWKKAKIFKLPYIKDHLSFKILVSEYYKKPFIEHDIVLALLIIFHPVVTHDIQLIITKIGLKEFIIYPKLGNIETLKFIHGNTPLGKFTLLENECELLLSKFKLQKNWLIPLMVYVLTDILPIPSYEDPFEFILNSTPNDKKYNHPRIVFNRQPTSLNEFKNWIDENWENDIKQHLNNLPTMKYSDTNISNLALGLVFGLIGGKKAGRNKVMDFLTKIEEIDENFFGDDGDSTPDQTKLTKLAFESKKKLQEFYPLKSE